jgi:hypothetical protein
MVKHKSPDEIVLIKIMERTRARLKKLREFDSETGDIETIDMTLDRILDYYEKNAR